MTMMVTITIYIICCHVANYECNHPLRKCVSLSLSLSLALCFPDLFCSLWASLPVCPSVCLIVCLSVCPSVSLPLCSLRLCWCFLLSVYSGCAFRTDQKLPPACTTQVQLCVLSKHRVVVLGRGCLFYRDVWRKSSCTCKRERPVWSVWAQDAFLPV